MKRKRRKEDRGEYCCLRKGRKRKKRLVISGLQLADFSELGTNYAKKRKRDVMEERSPYSFSPATPERRKRKIRKFVCSTKLFNCHKTQLMEYRRRMEYKFRMQKNKGLQPQFHSYRWVNSILFMTCCAREDKENWMVDE